MKLKVKYIFPASTPGVNNYICKLPEGLGTRRILTHGTKTQNPGKSFCLILDTLRVLYYLLLSMYKESKR